MVHCPGAGQIFPLAGKIPGVDFLIVEILAIVTAAVMSPAAGVLAEEKRTMGSAAASSCERVVHASAVQARVTLHESAM